LDTTFICLWQLHSVHARLVVDHHVMEGALNVNVINVGCQKINVGVIAGRGIVRTARHFFRKSAQKDGRFLGRFAVKVRKKMGELRSFAVEARKK